MKKRKVQNKDSKKNTSLSIKYEDINKKDEFKIRVFERITIRLLNILENRRP